MTADTFQRKKAGAGINNADLKDISHCHSNTISTWKGRAMVVVKSLRERGEIVLTASAKELPAANLTIHSQISKIR